MKSQKSTLLQIARGYLSDIQAAYACRKEEIERDFSRLVLGTNTRGLGFFTLDLPTLDDILTDGLRSGFIQASGPLTRRRSKKDQRPRFLWVLWSRIFDHTGCLKEAADPNAILFLRSISCLGKKIAVACSPNRLEKAVKEYHAIESVLENPFLDWELDELGLDLRKVPTFSSAFRHVHDDRSPDLFGQGFGSDEHEFDRELLQSLDYVSQEVACAIGYFDVFDAESSSRARFRHGPGAVADARGRTFKYDFPHWPRKLDGVFPYDWCGSHTIVPGSFPSVAEPPSRLIAVPKTAKSPRLIASEPIAHQWCQQFIASWLTERYAATFIGDFLTIQDQQPSRDLAQRASYSGDIATLDLSSASDRLSCKAVECLFRGNSSILVALHAARTRWVRDDISNPPNFLKLKKFSAQGSALTFPVQSVFFLACCLAACGATSKKDIDRLKGQVRVFGDDLIVPGYAYERLCRLLTVLGLKVNLRKSFSSGFFRESCGMDAFKGYDVTPLKPKTVTSDTPQDCQAVIDVANNLFSRGFWNAAKALESAAIVSDKLPIVGPSSGVQGLMSFCGTRTDHLRKRWNDELQIEQILIPQLISQEKRVSLDRESNLLQYFMEKPSPDYFWSSGVSHKRSALWRSRWVDSGYYTV